MRTTTSLLTATAALALGACTTTHRDNAEPLPSPAQAQAAAQAPTGNPDLLVVISVDQLSSDLMEEYGPRFRGGMKRLLDNGTVFLNGYQAQAATETCPGHSTILTGSLPARTGVVANNWIDLSIGRNNKDIYCAENPTLVAENGQEYVVSSESLLVPTLGTYMKRANPRARNVSIAGKDRSAVMLGGHDADQRWYWGNDGWTTDLGKDAPTAVSSASVATRNLLDRGSQGLEMPPYCAAKLAVPVDGVGQVGQGRLGWAAGDFRQFRASPAYDGAVLALGASMIGQMDLGGQGATDLISLGLSATDYVGHSYGPGGGEMCLQMFALDQNLGGFLDYLDGTGKSYAVVLTSDHGGLEIPERLNRTGEASAARLDKALTTDAIEARVGAQLGLTGDWLAGGAPGDIYLDPTMDPAMRTRAVAAVKAAYAAHPQVSAVYDEAELMQVPIPTGNPTGWTPIQRVRASYHPDRSGDVMVILKPLIMPIANPGPGYISTHGSPWDYDRRVPIMFYRPGLAGVKRADPARTVDILPTLAAQMGFSLGGQEIDGQCLAGVQGVAC